MVIESKEFSDRACASALDKLAGMITTRSDRNIIVFNPLARARTDVVRVTAAEVGPQVRLRDATTGKDVPHQTLADGTIIFVAADVPSLGYKTFSLLPPSTPRSSRREEALTEESNIANRK